MTLQKTSFLEQYKYFGFRKAYYILRHAMQRCADTLNDLRLFSQDAVLKRRMSRILIDHFNGDTGQNVNRDAQFIGFGAIHYAIVRNIKPVHILCVGSRKGYIPAILALACKANGFGHVDFVDAGYGPENPHKHWSGIGFWKKENPDKHFAKIGVSSYITTYVMNTKQYATKRPHQRYQYIYLDGDHSYEGVTFDYTLFWPRLDRGNFMSFHDVVAHGYLDKGLFGVWRVWKKIGNTHAIIFPFPKDSGLGIIQKI